MTNKFGQRQKKLDAVIYQVECRFIINDIVEWLTWIEYYKVPTKVLKTARYMVIPELFYTAIRHDDTKAVQSILKELWEGKNNGYSFRA